MTSNKTIKHYPLSSPQRDIWFDQILHLDVPLYNIGGYVRIDGSINPTLFDRAINQVIAENDALRIIIHEGESLPTQTFAENIRVKLDFHDFSEQENAHKLALKWMSEEFVKPFQLYDGLLFQFALCKASANCYYWLKKYHHLIADGWSMSLIVQRVAAAYNFLTTFNPSEQTNYAYPDFIQNDQAYLFSAKLVKAKDYWQAKYREVPEPLLVRHYAAQFQGKTIPSQRSILRLQRPFYNQLIDFAKENNVSTFHVILGTLYSYFVRTCDREDLVIGLPTLNRSSAAFKQTVGLFVGVSPAKFHFGLDLNFIELIQAIKGELQQNYRYQRFPISELNRQLGLQPENRQPLFDLTLSYMDQNYDANFEGSPVEFTLLPHDFEQNALAIFVDEFHKQGDIQVDFDYNLGFFETDEIEHLKARFEFILGEILRHPSVPVRELQIMPDVELKKILVDWNDTETDYPHDKTIVDLFEEQVAKTPDAIAVVFENQQLTYRGLNSKANQLARYLQTLGVKPEILVGICVERSIEMVIGLLGILKAGGAYLPLDPAYPTERLGFMLEDAQVPVLLTQSNLTEKLSETKMQVVCLDVEAETLSQYSEENFKSEEIPENLAYVIYTSGSTGQPKGACIYHRGLTNLVNWFVTDFNLTATDSVLVISPFAFDLTQKNFFAPLIVGGQLHLLPASIRYDPSQITQIVASQQITWLNCTPSAFYPLIEPVEKSTFQKLSSLRYIFLGGEPIFLNRFLPWLQSSVCKAKVVNTYGPTECTDVCAAYRLYKPESFLERSIPIGQPIFNAKLFILDKHLQLLPIGVRGELHIGGEGIGSGYINNAQMTQDKFIPDPFSDKPQSSLYKTGDLARYLPDGNIEYLGRIDNQVKIRGFRIELGEIEAVLSTHPTVRESVVIAHEVSEGDKHLVAYCVAQTDQVIENQTLRAFLKERLPDYMVPAFWVEIEAMPLTPSGKIDRRALPIPTLTREALEKAYVAPLTALEYLLAELWQEILGVEQIGIEDNFFELGGTSISGMVFINRLQEKLQSHLYPIALFEAPNIADFITYLKKHYTEAVSKLCHTEAGLEPIQSAPHPPIDSSKVSKLRQLIAESPFFSTRFLHIKRETERLPPAIFILSPPRSGSTLLRVMLAGHPDLFVPPELELLSFENLQQRKAIFSEPYQFALEGTIRAMMALKGCTMERATKLMAEYENQNLTTPQFYHLIQTWCGEKTLIDKTPSYALALNTLKRAESYFENARYIHLLRHPYGMIHSFEEAKFDQLWFRFAHHFSARELGELTWLISQQNIRDFLQEIPTERQHRLTFEELVREPRTVLESLCHFLGLAFHPDMLQPYQDKQQRMTDSLYQESKMVGDPKFHTHKQIEPQTAERWRNTYTADFLGEVTWEMAESLGYSKISLAESHQAPSILSSPLVTLQPGDKNRLPFFCIHPIGGNVFWYMDLARHLGAEQPFYGLQSAGLYGEREPLTRIEDMARLYIEALQTIQPQGPYQLGGWSLGGVVAFEMAQQLRQQGHQIKLLALIDSYVPTASNFPFDLDETQLMTLFTRDLSGIFGNPLTLAERQQRESNSYQQLNFTLEQAKKLNDLPAPRKQQHHLWQVFKANRLAMTRYQPQNYPGQLIWFGASDSRIKVSKAVSEWQELVTSGIIKIYTFPGDHYSLLQEQTVKCLAEKLGTYLGSGAESSDEIFK
jgi:amino acid adenylation domain-containing protein